MDDKEVLAQINKLAEKEHELFRKEADEGVTDEERAELKKLEVTLDQCWDLLHQRRQRSPRFLAQDWYEQVIAAANRAAERYWQIPLIDDYVPEMDSWYGDLQNSGSAEGSLVKSGLFLREFRTVPWAHLDIGGTGYFRKSTPYAARGATGVTHATLVELALAGAKG